MPFKNFDYFLLFFQDSSNVQSVKWPRLTSLEIRANMSFHFSSKACSLFRIDKNENSLENKYLYQRENSLNKLKTAENKAIISPIKLFLKFIKISIHALQSPAALQALFSLLTQHRPSQCRKLCYHGKPADFIGPDNLVTLCLCCIDLACRLASFSVLPRSSGWRLLPTLLLDFKNWTQSQEWPP